MFYGWKIVAVAFLNHFVSVGFIFYSYGTFFKALAAEFGGSRASVALGLSLMNCAAGVFSPFLGRAIEQYSIRWVMCAGACLFSAGFLLASRIGALWHFYLLLTTLLGLGSAMIGALPSTTLVANWFVDRRGTALGLATVGISVSGLVMAPIATRLIEGVGWRGTFLVYAAMVLLLIVPGVWAVVVNRPEDLGLRPDGPGKKDRRTAEVAAPLGAGAQVVTHESPAAWPVARFLRDRSFWAIAVAIALDFSANGAILTHSIPHVTDLGFPATQAAFVVSSIAGLGVVGKVLFGWLSDRMDKRFVLWLGFGLQAIGTLFLSQARSYPALLGAGAIFGLGMGGVMPMWGALVGAAFGRRAFSRAMGLMGPIMVPIQSAGGPIAGLLYDNMGTYDIAFWVCVGTYLSAMCVLLLLKLPGKEPGTVTTLFATE